MFEPAEACLRAAEETSRAVRGETTHSAIDLIVGTRQELGLSWLLPQFGSLERARPWLQLHLDFGSGPDLLLRLRTMEVDCAITSSRLADPKLDSLRLHREDYVFCGSHTLLKKTPFAKADDARDHVLLDASPDCPLFRYWKDSPDGGDRLRFGRGVWLGSIEAIRIRMLAAAGVGVLPAYLVEPDLKSGRLVRILPKVKPLHDYFRLVFRGGDPRRALFDDLATLLSTNAAPMKSGAGCPRPFEPGARAAPARAFALSIASRRYSYMTYSGSGMSDSTSAGVMSRPP